MKDNKSEKIRPSNCIRADPQKIGKKRLVSKVSDFSLVAFDCVAVTVLSAIYAQWPKKTSIN